LVSLTALASHFNNQIKVSQDVEERDKELRAQPFVLKIVKQLNTQKGEFQVVSIGEIHRTANILSLLHNDMTKI